MKTIRLLLADDHPPGTSVARPSLIGRTSGREDGRRWEGPRQGGFSLELLPFWKSRKVFSCLPHNFHFCFRIQAGLPRVAGSVPEPASPPTRRLSPLVKSSRRRRTPFGTPRRVLPRLTAPRVRLACRLGSFVTNPREQFGLEEFTCI